MSEETPTEDSLRDSLEAAVEASEVEEVKEEIVEESTPTPQELMEEPKDQLKDEPKDERKEVEAKVEVKDDTKVETQVETPVEAKEVSTIKPPPSWSAKDREQWGELSENLQKTIIDRERNYSIGIQKHAEGAKFAQKVVDTLAPYRHIMMQEGADEVAAIGNLAQYAATMRVGTQQEKANTLARIIQQYGVDIPTLDNVLSGQGVDPETSRIDQILQQRLAPVEQMVQDFNRGREENLRSTDVRLQKEIDDFGGKSEFMEDVREDMADILELNANRGKEVTLEQAYEKAVAMRPDIQEIINSRNKKKELQNSRRKIANKENAASSLDGGSQAPLENKEAPSVRGAIADAWESQEQSI